MKKCRLMLKCLGGTGVVRGETIRGVGVRGWTYFQSPKASKKENCRTLR